MGKLKYLIYTILIVYFFEIYLSRIIPEFIENYRFKKALENKNFDKRTRLEIYKDLNQFDNYTVTTSPINFINKSLIPLSGISLKKTIDCNEDGFFSIFLSDRYGFNNPDYLWESDQLDAILIGDSFTMGSCVNRENSISGNLLLENFININLGYSGNGPLLELASLKEYYPTNKKVKYIIHIFYEGNDYHDLIMEKNSQLTNYIENNFSQNLISLDDKKNLFLAKEIEKGMKISSIKYLKIKQIFKLFNLRSRIKLIINRKNNEFSFDFDLLEKIFINIKRFASDRSVEYLVIYIPDAINSNFYDESHKKLKKILSKNDINFLDFKKSLTRNNKNISDKFFPAKYRSHLNGNGYKFVANEILKITNNNQ